MSEMNENAINDEQWKTGGDCRVRRKVKYCGHICTVRKRMRKHMQNALLHALRTTTMRKKI